MGKASACRMILGAVKYEHGHPGPQKGIAGIDKALFRMKCTYDPADTERVLTSKCIVTQRSRPINADNVEGFGTLEHKVCFVTGCPYQSVHNSAMYYG